LNLTMQRKPIARVTIALSQDYGSNRLRFLRRKHVRDARLFCAVVIRDAALKLKHVANRRAISEPYYLDAVRRRVVGEVELLIGAEIICAQALFAGATSNQIPLGDSMRSERAINKRLGGAAKIKMEEILA
jgi:hypothetical protein